MTPDEHTIHEYMLAVGDGHELYVQEWGKRSARRTFLFLHGGPGSGCRTSAKALFDGTRDHVVFFDQRGAGKSTPAGACPTAGHAGGRVVGLLPGAHLCAGAPRAR